MEIESKRVLIDNAPYAGFMIRLLAYLIDGCIYLFGFVILFFLLCGICRIVSGQEVAGVLSHLYSIKENPPADALMMSALPYTIALGALSFIGGIAYNAGFNSSKFMATPGKIATGIIVVNQYGERISIWRAIARAVFYTASCTIIVFVIPSSLAAKLLTILVYWGGYLHILIDTRKRGLHDMVCGTFVLYKFHIKKENLENFFDKELP